MSQSNNGILGFLVFARHGAVNTVYQNSTTIVPLSTSPTSLGTQQEYNLGQQLRSSYLNSSSPAFVSGVSANSVDQTQILATADVGPTGDVANVNSATVVLQGLYSNESVMTGPIKYVPIDPIEVENDFTFEGWVDCAPFDNATASFYASPEFKAKQDQNAAFLSGLSQYLDGKVATLENMWDVFEFLESKNDTSLPPAILEQARELAIFHEQGVYTSVKPDGIGNIGGQSLLLPIINNLNRIANESDPLKIVYGGISHQPFLSLFNMTGAAQQQPALANITIDYSAALVIEVRKPVDPGSDDPVLSFLFKNGPNDQNFNRFNVLGQNGDVSISLFIGSMAPFTIVETQEWCSICQNTKTRGCGSSTSAGGGMSSLHGGLLGGAIVISILIVGLLAFFIHKYRSKRRYHNFVKLEAMR